ncbi:hypothetical protein [Actinoplanes flavus]|uniref:Uncharacterized protein n=1 Tax=Actinoplanes flavus TaxID=2820290 RepID=A0ABS3UCU9_9ACTN|nr:hypothetical protein [Actinoplanes flavus]MBO3736599.1 hypothetical protein [Actinoplanes flavus]
MNDWIAIADILGNLSSFATAIITLIAAIADCKAGSPSESVCEDRY